jgi:hypothetical protein
MNIWTFPFGIAVGGGSGMFSAGIDWMFPRRAHSNLQISQRTIRTTRCQRMSFGGLSGAVIFTTTMSIKRYFLQPNVHYLLKVIVLDLAVGPEIGWKTQTGFDYGASVRTGLMGCAQVEVGRFFNSKKTYVNFLFNLPFGPMLGWKLIEKKKSE